MLAYESYFHINVAFSYVQKYEFYFLMKESFLIDDFESVTLVLIICPTLRHSLPAVFRPDAAEFVLVCCHNRFVLLMKVFELYCNSWNNGMYLFSKMF